MKKIFFRSAFVVAAVAAVGLGSYKAYGSYTAANMSEEDLLMAENVLALADDCPEGMVPVKGKAIAKCYKRRVYQEATACCNADHPTWCKYTIYAYDAGVKVLYEIGSYVKKEDSSKYTKWEESMGKCNYPETSIKRFIPCEQPGHAVKHSSQGIM